MIAAQRRKHIKRRSLRGLLSVVNTIFAISVARTSISWF
jgi:hypothetical protein